MQYNFIRPKSRVADARNSRRYYRIKHSTYVRVAFTNLVMCYAVTVQQNHDFVVVLNDRVY